MSMCMWAAEGKGSKTMKKLRGDIHTQYISTAKQQQITPTPAYQHSEATTVGNESVVSVPRNMLCFCNTECGGRHNKALTKIWVNHGQRRPLYKCAAFKFPHLREIKCKQHFNI